MSGIPRADAIGVAEKLIALGFDVDAKYDLDQRGMEKAFMAFSKKLKSGNVGFFYYAGHAIEMDGENYLIPINAAINDADDEEGKLNIQFNCINVRESLSRMEKSPTLINIMM